MNVMNAIDAACDRSALGMAARDDGRNVRPILRATGTRPAGRIVPTGSSGRTGRTIGKGATNARTKPANPTPTPTPDRS